MSENIFEKLKELDGFWGTDGSVPDLFDKDILNNEVIVTNSYSDNELYKVIEIIKAKISQRNVKKESETCSKIINPLLEVLGYCENSNMLVDEQRVVVQDGVSYIPDYCLFDSEDNQSEANDLDEKSYYDAVKLILEAKRVQKDLYKKPKKTTDNDDLKIDTLESSSPLLQMRKYLRVSNTKVGILTNGLDWVLVYRDSENHNSVYHINLQSLIEQIDFLENPKAILYWLIPFGKIFLSDNEGQKFFNLISKTEIKRNSLEEDLKNRLEPVLTKLLNIYCSKLKSKANIGAKKEDALKEILNFVYLIFYIACLENRNLLPMSNPIYFKSYSIKGLFKSLLKENTFSKVKSYHIYNHLDSLISLVAGGCKGLSNQGIIGGLPSVELSFKISKKLRIEDGLLREVILEFLKSPSSDGEMADFRLLDTIQFGNIYEHILRLDIQYNKKKKIFQLSESSKKNERTTAVYTPRHIVKEMVANSLSELNFLNWSEVEDFTAIDPCFGSGHFMIELSRQLAVLILEQLTEENIPILKDKKIMTYGQKLNEIQRHLFINNLYGVDRGVSCIDVAKYSIWLATLTKGKQPIYLDENLKIGNSLYGRTNLEEMGKNKSELSLFKKKAKIRLKIKKKIENGAANGSSLKQLIDVENSLQLGDKNRSFRNYFMGVDKFKNKNEIINQQQPFFWLNEFPEVFLKGGFSFLITNPPYDQVRPSPNTLKYHHEEHKNFRLSLMTDKDIENYVVLFENDEQYKNFQQGNKNLFEAFILLKDKILKPYGLYSYIVPNKILASEQTSKIRAKLWQETLTHVQEFPEKDAVSRRVFKSKKVACAILYGKNHLSLDNVVKVEVFPDANDLTSKEVGVIDFMSSQSLNPDALPIVLQSSSQKQIVEELSKFELTRLNKKFVKDGELDESFNKTSLVDENCGTPVYSTNRMQPFGFTFWTKQETVKYCDLKKAKKISKNKLEDRKEIRVGVNGIAGANDTRVLNTAVLPSNLLINNNINYINVSDILSYTSIPFYLSLTNSIPYDQIIRIEKKTNHNSSSMIANLPIILTKGISDDSLLEVIDISKKSMVTKENGRLFINGPFKKWLEEAAKVRILALQKINFIITDLLIEIHCIQDLTSSEEDSVCRKFMSDTFSVLNYIKSLNVSGAKGKQIKLKLKSGHESVRMIKDIINTLDILINSNLLRMFNFKQDKISELLSLYGLDSAKKLPKNLLQMKAKVEDISTETSQLHYSVDLNELDIAHLNTIEKIEEAKKKTSKGRLKSTLNQ